MVSRVLEGLGVSPALYQQGDHPVHSPIDGECIGRVRLLDRDDVAASVTRATEAFQAWRQIPAPRRGVLVRRFGDVLRQHKAELGELVSWETGKIQAEGLGEVQEVIDICDFAVGLSRQLYGLTIASERPGHHMRETWHPLGVVAVISAFNFPVAVWAWNTALALVCGNSVIWKPSEKTPITALACQHLLTEAANEVGDIPRALSQVILGDAVVGEQMVKDKRLSLISATGSTAMGRKVDPMVAERFGRSILELGGNNAMIIAPSADLSLAVRAIVFGAVGTAGQRCTTTRRLLVHSSIYDELVSALKSAYNKITIGDPMKPNTLVGPLIDEPAFNAMQAALNKAKDLGGSIHGGERVYANEMASAYYVKPALVEM